MLAERPPISIPLTSVPPALLEELVSDLSSLASAYHKPASTFIGRGRQGAAALAQRRDDVTREKALATVVQGQGAENLLDFDADDDVAASSAGAGGASGLGGLDELMNAPQPSAQTAQSGAGSLNDLLGLFDAAPGAGAPGAQSGLDALSAIPMVPSQPLSPMNPTNGASSRAPTQVQAGGDLLDLL